MPRIPPTINGVVIDFNSSVNPEVDQGVINGLKHCIKREIAPGYWLQTIYISSASDSHSMPSRHAQGKAVDISRINGSKMILAYPQDPAIRAMVDAIQERFETFTHRRENFGPYLKKKLGQDWPVGGHDDHIHLSVN